MANRVETGDRDWEPTLDRNRSEQPRAERFQRRWVDAVGAEMGGRRGIAPEVIRGAKRDSDDWLSGRKQSVDEFRLLCVRVDRSHNHELMIGCRDDDRTRSPGQWEWDR